MVSKHHANVVLLCRIGDQDAIGISAPENRVVGELITRSKRSSVEHVGLGKPTKDY